MIDDDDVQHMGDNEDAAWLRIARIAYDESTAFLKKSVGRQIEKNKANFSSKHPHGSKYYTKEYAHRSRLFIPKTRSSVRRMQSACAMAFLSTADVVTVSPYDDSKIKQKQAAEVMGEILNFHLTRNIPWTTILLGALQDSLVTGLVCSKQSWVYKSREDKVPLIESLTGFPLVDVEGRPRERTVTTVTMDHPEIELVPIENLRFAPYSEWTDVVEESPYLIRVIPMTVGDCLSRMGDSGNSKHEGDKWKKLSAQEILSAGVDNEQVYTGDTTLREEDAHSAIDEFSTVWVRENYIKKEGEDWFFYSLGAEKILTDPVMVRTTFPRGKRPYVIGRATIDAHETYPTSYVQLGEQLQAAVNELANSRRDNVEFVLNKRKYVRNTANIDIDALLSSEPGRVIMTDDPARDVKEEVIPDITSAAYREHDVLSADLDSILGSFSSASVATNRRLNETVGGMQLLSQDAGNLVALAIRIFSETWVEVVLRQLMGLIKAYETNEELFAMAGGKVGLSEITDDILNQELSVRVDVGVDSANPKAQLEKFIFGMTSLAQLSQVPGLNREEVIKEVMGSLGYKDGMRFIEAGEGSQPGEGGQQEQQKLQAGMQSVQMEQQKLQTNTQLAQQKMQIDTQSDQQKVQANTQLAQQKLQVDLQIAQLSNQIEQQRMQMDREMAMIKLANDREMSVEALRNKLGIEQFKVGAVQKQKAYIDIEKERTKRMEMQLKTKMGSGI